MKFSRENKYDFDQWIDRKNTNSLKYDFAMQRKQRDDLLPLWVADMDFKLPEEVISNLRKCLDHGIFGYTDSGKSYFDALQKWFYDFHRWKIKKEWNTITPGVVFAICLAIRAFTKIGESVLIQQPVYYPFKESIERNGRKCVNNQLRYQDGKYSMDFADFESKIIENKVRLFILCSPHNPVGRVWTKEELLTVGKLCLKHHVVVISDEIHCDFTYSGYQHTCFATISEQFAQNAIICTSPSKTFNIAGLQMSNIIIPNEGLRLKFQKEKAASGYSQSTTFGIAACESVYSNGASWYLELKDYLEKNLNFVRIFLIERIPEVKLVEPEGTYLVWLDFSGLGISAQQLEKLIVEDARLWLDSGEIFGAEAALFERINIACPKSTLNKALQRLENAVKLYRKSTI